MESWLRTEMEQEPHLEIGRAQIVVALTRGDPLEVAGRLDLNDQDLVHHQVESLASELFAFVRDADGKLSIHLVAALEELKVSPCRRFVACSEKRVIRSYPFHPYD
jgi:hypothetical protein